MKYIDSEKLIAEINNRLMSVNLEELGNFGCHRVWAYNDVKDLITSLQQEQPEHSDFDDVDPNHLIHSHYTKVREIKTGREFWAEYSSEAAEWYEAGTGKAYSIHKVEIVKEQPEVDLEKELDRYLRGEFQQTAGGNFNNYIQVARHFYELGKNARKEENK